MGISPATLRSAFLSLKISAHPGLQIQSALLRSLEGLLLGLVFFVDSLCAPG